MTYEKFELKAFDGLNLYYQEWKPDTKPKGVICFTHGLGEHSGRYSHWAAKLNQAGYAFLAYDLRGHGKSDGQRGYINSFNDFIKDTDQLLEVAKKRFPEIPQFLYGHSIGAIIVWAYCLKKKPKVAGVILSALSFRNALEEQKGKVVLAKIMGTIFPKMTLSSGLNPSTISKDPEVVSAYINDPLVHKYVTVRFAKNMIGEEKWALQHAKEWKLPVLVMHGEEDMLGYAKGSEEFAAIINCDCTLKVWPGMFHEIHNEPDKDLVFEFLRTWLDEHTNV